MRVRGLIAAALCGVVLVGFGRPAFADTTVPVVAAGSTTAENAVLQWSSDLLPTGMRIDYSGVGTLGAQSQYAGGVVDFAVLEFPYETPPARPFASVPLVAQATSITYRLTIGGTRVTGLRLSGATVAGIFTGTITRWNDPAIHADNPGLALPDSRIIPVVRSDSSGPTAVFTGWLAARHPDLWHAYCDGCGSRTSYPNAGQFVGQAGGLGVAAVVSTTEGAIAFSTPPYDRSLHLPDALVRNAAGYYTAPTSDSIAIGLTAADGSGDPGPVFANPDPRAYPIVGYENMIVPTTGLIEAKGRTITQFAAYAVCAGQASASLLAYGPLPMNLSRVALDRLRQVPGADLAALDPAACANPAADVPATAPYPSTCGTAVSGVADGCEGTEVITTTVSPGALYLSVVPGDVTLPSPVLTPDGEKLVTAGDLHTLTVADTRAGNPGWSVSGQVTDFTSGGAQRIAAANLGWTPAVVDQVAVQRVTAGPRTTGLAESALLAQAPAGFGTGTARLGAHLTLDVPTTTLAGTYTATLTFTVI